MSEGIFPTTANLLLREAADALSKADSGSPRREARLLLADLISCSADALIMDDSRRVDDLAASAFRDRVARRRAGEPVSRILGYREFWSLRFDITADVLDPRPDSETLVAAVLDHRGAAHPQRVLDLGTGSGCLLIALLHSWPEAIGIGVDRSAAALAIAAGNATRLGIGNRASFAHGDWYQDPPTVLPDGPFDVIISNPPYIPHDDLETLPTAVRDFDPVLALDGGPDGLDAYRAIARQARARISETGVLGLEIGFDQAHDVTGILREAGWNRAVIRQDLAGMNRCIIATV